MGARWVFVLVFVLMLCRGTAVRAQDEAKFGITMETPTTAGVIWHISHVVAIQPEIGFSTSSSEGERSTTDKSGITTGVSARIYFHSWDKVRAYVSPKYGYSRLTQHGGSSSLTLENKDVTNSFTGSFGAQYSPHKRFAVFAETGVTYSRLTFTSSSTIALLGSESTTSGWRSGSSVGGIFYLW